MKTVIWTVYEKYAPLKSFEDKKQARDYCEGLNKAYNRGKPEEDRITLYFIKPETIGDEK